MGGTRGGRILKLSVSIHGYPFACVRHGGSKTNVYVHRSLAEAFIPNPCDLPQVNHVDGNKLHASIENLEWCTASQNSLHAFAMGMSVPINRKPLIGEKDGVERYYESLCAAGRDGFNVHNISAVLHGRRKTSGGYRWRFA
jgi:hypothetical protein